MLDDLNMSGVQYNIAVSVFFITYIIFGMRNQVTRMIERKY